MLKCASATSMALLAVGLVPAVAAAGQDAGSKSESDRSSESKRTQVVKAGTSEPLAELEQAGDVVKLSDERKVTRWAHAQENAKIRREPRGSARTITRLRFFTEDKRAEVYLVLSATMDEMGRTWLRIRVPKRPNGQKGWVLEDQLSRMYTVRTRLVINRKTLRATLYKKGKRIWSARVGVGKSRTPTPKGNFYIRERLRGLGNDTTYGPWAFGTSAYSNLSDWPGGGVVGIHGTNQPNLVPGRPSHGCVRVRNRDIRRLARLMPVGTPVRVQG